MTIQAYVLVDISAKRPAAVVAEIGDMEGVVSAQPVTGPHDAIVLVNADDMTRMGRLVMEEIRGIEGVSRTMTCVVAD